jgi:MFS family permease
MAQPAAGSPDAPRDGHAPTARVPTSPTVPTWPMWALGLVLLLDSVDQSIVRGLITPLKEEFGVGDFSIGLLTSAFILVNGLVTVPAGYLADRWHRTRTIGHTVLGWSGITALCAVAPTFPALVGIRAMLGFGQAITEPSAASLIADYYPTTQRGRAFSIQQVMLFAGYGLGVGIGGVVGNTLGWRWAFTVVALPGILVALLAYRLREPARGAADRLHVGLDADVEDGHHQGRLFDGGIGPFVRDMARGLRADLRTIFSITTMKYALVGVAVLLFVFTAVSTWLSQFYERQLGIGAGAAEAWFALLVLVGAIPGILLGGRVADRYATRVRGARVALPAWFIMTGTTLFVISWVPGVPFAAVWLLEAVGLFVMAMAIPGLRAGLSDAVPANLRGAGFGAFNLVSVILGGAGAPLAVSALSTAFDDNLRTAFLLVTPLVYLGALVLLRARDHLEADAMKIFEAVVRAMQEQQARDAGH